MSQLKRSLYRFVMGIVTGLVFCSASHAASQTRSPTSCVNATGTGTVAWTNSANAQASDDVYVTASVDGTSTQYLRCSGYGFTIPNTALIMGVTVTVERKSNSTANGGSNDAAVRLVKAGTIGTTDRSTATIYTTADVAENHGGVVDKWGTSWTPADINGNTFGAAFSATKASGSGGAHTISVDAITITVNYLPCSAPSNVPAGVTVSCYCDNFTTALTNSPIFNSPWTLSNSDGLGNPYISANGLLRLTEDTGNNAKAATVPGIFPAAGNYISVEFQHYAYSGSTPGADGIAVTLSDSNQPAVPGAFGGSLGYAPKTPPAVAANVPGFQGGWLGVALDEWGNFQSATEGRTGGPGQIAQSIGLRGPGSGVNGYRWIGGTTGSPGGLAVDSPASATPARGYLYQVIVDARSSASSTINVSVNRDSTTRDGTAYTSLFAPFNAYTEANYAQTQGWITQVVPDYWKVSFTGSTGGANNIHEIGALRICAQAIFPPTGGTASGFSAIDEAYPVATNSIPAYPNFQTGDIYMKLQGQPFKLWVAALTGTGISTAYSATTNKFVQVKLVNNSDNACGTSPRTCNATCTGKTAVEAGATQALTYTSSDKGGKLTANFTLNSAYSNLLAIMTECTTAACTAFTATAPACSVDSFSVRPTGITSVTSNLTNASVLRAGSTTFPLTATIPGVAGSPNGYTGTLKINNSAIQMAVNASTTGLSPVISPSTFPAAVSATPNATATGSNFTFSEVGAFSLPGATDASSPRGVYDGVLSALECLGTTAQCDTLKGATWTGIDSISTKGDCIADSFSNVIDTSAGTNKGKYGCNFGLNTTTANFGRFIPYQFGVTAATITPRSDFGSGAGCTPASIFTYMGEPFRVQFTLNALNGSGGITKNYSGASLAKFFPAAANWTQFNSSNTMGLWVTAINYPTAGQCKAIFSPTSPSFTTSFACTVGTKPSINRTAGTRVFIPAAGTGSPTATNWVDGSATYTSDITIQKAEAPDGPYNEFQLGIYPLDPDGVSPVATALNVDADNSGTAERLLLGTTQIRYGVLRLDNSFGSGLQNIIVNARAQNWNGSAYVNNLDDSCTQLTTLNLAFGNYTGGLAPSASTAISLLNVPVTLAAGSGTLQVSKPIVSGAALRNRGSVDLSSIAPLSTYLPGVGRLVFGVARNRDQFIYLREIH